MAESGDPLLVAERGLERLPERDTDVLDGVVGVDVKVAAAPDLESDAGVLGERGLLPLAGRSRDLRLGVRRFGKKGEGSCPKLVL